MISQVCGHLALLSLTQFQLQSTELREHPPVAGPARPHASPATPAASTAREDQNPSKSPSLSPAAVGGQEVADAGGSAGMCVCVC